MTTPRIAITQGIFDIVVEHASKMPRQSCLDGPISVCAYRDGKGNACFVGALLSDEEASSLVGDQNIKSVTEIRAAGKLPDRLNNDVVLIIDLQMVHDTQENWEDDGEGPPKRERMASKFREIAEIKGLDHYAINTFFAA